MKTFLESKTTFLLLRICAGAMLALSIGGLSLWMASAMDGRPDPRADTALRIALAGMCLTLLASWTTSKAKGGKSREGKDPGNGDPREGR